MTVAVLRKGGGSAEAQSILCCPFPSVPQVCWLHRKITCHLCRQILLPSSRAERERGRERGGGTRKDAFVGVGSCVGSGPCSMSSVRSALWGDEAECGKRVRMGYGEGERKKLGREMAREETIVTLTEGSQTNSRTKKKQHTYT